MTASLLYFTHSDLFFKILNLEKNTQITINRPWASFHTSPYKTDTSSSQFLLAPQVMDAPSTRLAYPDMLLQ